MLDSNKNEKKLSINSIVNSVFNQTKEELDQQIGKIYET